jgi:hypothetical protein
MSIGAIGQTYSTATILSAVNRSSPVSASSGSGRYKDSATISAAAKELAAQRSGTASQEEASESASEKIQEQLAGLQ